MLHAAMETRLTGAESGEQLRVQVPLQACAKTHAETRAQGPGAGMQLISSSAASPHATIPIATGWVSFRARARARRPLRPPYRTYYRRLPLSPTPTLLSLCALSYSACACTCHDLDLALRGPEGDPRGPSR